MSDFWDSDLRELHERLTKARARLKNMAIEQLDTSPLDAIRLNGKSEGIALAISYVEEMQRINGEDIGH